MLLIGLQLVLLAHSLSSGRKVEEIRDNKVSSFSSRKFFGRITRITINRVTQILLIYSSILVANNLIITKISIYQGIFKLTTVTQCFDLFFLLVGFLVLQLTSNYPYQTNNLKDSVTEKINNLTEIQGIRKGEYPIIIIFNLIGGSLLLSSNDLVTMFLALELQSYSLYIISTMDRDSQKATQGGLKYFLLGGLASAIILLASAIIYGITGLTNFEEISLFASCLTKEMRISLELTILLILQGYLFKIGGAPFHNWSPDVYDGQPTIVTTWIAILPKIALLIFLFEFLSNFQQSFYDQILMFTSKDILMISSALSLLIGTIGGLSQYRIKRLLAYSTISHIGFLLLGLSIMSPDSIESFFFYLFQYSLMNVNIFLILIGFGYLILKQTNFELVYLKEKSSPVELISQLKGQFHENPWLATCFIITLFSFAGVPPFIGFFGKQFILLSAIKNGYIFLAFLGIISSIISAAYYLKIVKNVCFNQKEYIINENIESFMISSSDKPSSFARSKTIYLSNWLSFTISILTLFIILFIFKADFILNSAHLLALTYQYH